MISHCQKCQKPISPTTTHCEHCSSSLLDFESRLQQATELIEKEDYPAALRQLNGVIVDAPSSRLAECYAVRGFAQLKSLNFVRAEEDCTEAIGLNWDQSQTYVWRAAARGEQNKWRLAFDDLDRACEIGGPLRDQYFGLMESLAATASEFFRDQIAAGNGSAQLFFERGWIYLRCGKYQKAERDFQHALREQPHHPWASVGMAELRLHQRETTGVRELCDAGVLGDKSCRRRALQIRAELNFQAGDNALAKQDLDQLAEMAGSIAQEIVETARLRSRLGDHVSAIDQLNQVLEQSPEHQLAWLVRGDCYQEIRNYGLAIIDYTRYLEFFPKDVAALVRRAKMYLATKRWVGAHADLERAIGIDETDFEAHLVLSKLHLEENCLDQALNQCRLAVHLDNQRSEGFAVLATIYNRLCDYGNAIEEFSRSIELAQQLDEKSQYRYLRGIAYYELGDFEKALQDLNRASLDRPNHAGSWIWKAATCARLEAWTDTILGLQQAILVRPSASEQYQKLGRPVAERAIEFFNQQQQRGYSKPDLFRNRALASQFLDLHAEAIQDYSIALKHDSDDVETLIRRGQAFTCLGDTSAAIKDFTNIILQDKHNHRARYCRAIANLADGNLEAAKKDLQKAIQTAPDQPRYYNLLGELWQKLGAGPAAIAAFDRAILQDPTNPLTYRRRGMAHLSLGQHLQAIRDFSHSLELNPVQLDLLVQRGQTYLKSNQPLMAIEDFELALTNDPRLAKAYSGRAAVLLTQDRFEYALIWLTKAIHRFSDPRELSEVVFARGKVFYQMGRTSPAISDFTTVMELMVDDPKTVAAARYARGIAQIHAKQFESAARDFRKLLVLRPHAEQFRAALDWLANRNQPLPTFLQLPGSLKPPTRPPVLRNGVALSDQTIAKCKNERPFDAWIVRTPDKREYGPILLPILAAWALEGRLDLGMKLLRADWSKWKRIEKILPEITPLESLSGLIEEFPELNLGTVSSRHLAED